MNKYRFKTLDELKSQYVVVGENGNIQCEKVFVRGMYPIAGKPLSDKHNSLVVKYDLNGWNLKDYDCSGIYNISFDMIVLIDNNNYELW